MALSSSSSSDARITYDVFLSFRGETRGSFSDHLYADLRRAGVNIFRDDESIRRGENISIELSRAIEESRISIIVFSKDYAGSRWCLDELVKIMECKQKLNQIVYPIFYHVDPSDVRKHTSTFGEALTLHKQRFGDQKVNEWKDALTAAANLSGWDLQTMPNGYESKFIEEITKEVLRVVNFIPMNVAKHPVGIDYHVRGVLNLLQMQTNDGVRMIGIFGMGGVGKSTIAKAIYNHLIMSFQEFEGSCFVANIRQEVSNKGDNGLVSLQEKLLHKTLKTKNFEIDNVDEGISLIRARLRCKRVLIVLDGIDHISQLDSLAGQRNWFCSGSTIIITTRDVHLLSELGTQEKYKVETLSIYNSLELLSWHVFGVPIALEEYTEVSKAIASYTKGLPLALTIIGSYLRGRSVQEWIEYVEKLRSKPPDGIQTILEISYDALDGDTKNIFLDIACFFVGHYKKDIVMVLEACGFHAEIGIRSLIEKCLLTIDNGYERTKRLGMHDLVQAMGKEIVRKKSSGNLGNQSRLMGPNDVFDVLQGNKGTEAIEGMVVNSNLLKNVNLSTEVFTKMVNLRILILDGVVLRGSFKNFSNELRLLRLRNCHLSHIQSDFRFARLVELDLSNNNIEEFQPNMQHFVRLRMLNLDDCEQLKSTPDFTGAQSLQEISFRACSNLANVHPSIGSLEKLVMLNLTGCKKLKVLPTSICKLKSLEELFLIGCKNLRELPIDIGKLEQLRKLEAQGTSISHLPFSLGCLKNLESLELGKLVGSVAVDFLPSSAANLCSLNSLEMSFNKLQQVVISFPIGLWSLTSLTHLTLEGIRHLESPLLDLSHLSNLQWLYLEDLQNLRALLKLPPSLIVFGVVNCESLEKIPDISNLRRLYELSIVECKSLVEFSGLESPKYLTSLAIRQRNALHECLQISLGSLTSLTFLDLSGRCWCHLQSLPFNLSHLSNLFSLSLDDWQNLRALLQLPLSLRTLSAKNCASLEKIANLESLESLYIPNCKSLVELPGLESLTCVEIRNCSALRIPSIENWFQAHCEGNTVQISLRVSGYGVYCSIPRLLRHTSSFEISNRSFDDKLKFDGVGVSVRSKTTGAWIVKEPPKHIKFENFKFKVETRIGEVLEVYAHFYVLQMEKMQLCLFEIHRNEDGEVRFFPSTRGFEEIDDGTTDNIDGCLGSTRQNENRLMIEEEQNGWSRRRCYSSCNILWEFIRKCFCWDEQGR